MEISSGRSAGVPVRRWLCGQASACAYRRRVYTDKGGQTTRTNAGPTRAKGSGPGVYLRHYRLPGASCAALTGLQCLAGRVLPGWGVRDRLTEPAGVVVRPQAFEDGQRLGELRVSGAVVLSLAVEQAVGVQQPSPAVGEGHGLGAVQALLVGGPGQVMVAVARQDHA